jgi:hypothetical protein
LCLFAGSSRLSLTLCKEKRLKPKRRKKCRNEETTGWMRRRRIETQKTEMKKGKEERAFLENQPK